MVLLIVGLALILPAFTLNYAGRHASYVIELPGSADGDCPKQISPRQSPLPGTERLSTASEVADLIVGDDATSS
jgi:hypothetical protein